MCRRTSLERNTGYLYRYFCRRTLREWKLSIKNFASRLALYIFLKIADIYANIYFDKKSTANQYMFYLTDVECATIYICTIKLYPGFSPSAALSKYIFA